MAATEVIRSRSVGSPTAGSSPTVAQRTHLGTSGILLIALLITLSGLHEILQDIVWWFDSALLSALLIGVGAAVRRFFAARAFFLVPIAGVVVLIGTVTLFFAPQNALLGLIPTFDTLADFGALADAANQSIATQSLPAIATTPILFLICLGIGAITICADFFANGLRTPALVGIPILTLLAVPALVSLDATDPIVFVGAALAYLALLAPTPVRQTRRAVPLAAAIVVGTLVLPLVLPAVIPAQGGTGTGFSTGINPVITLGQNLRQDIEHTVLTYRTRSGNAEYLRIVNVDNFTGSNWSPSKPAPDRSHSINQIGAPPGLSGEVKTTRETSRISVKGLTSPWLPLPYPTSRITGLQGNWYWDTNNLVVHSPSRTAENQDYEATSVTITPSPTQLEQAGKIVPANFEKYLALPPNLPSVIRETANRIAGQASSNYQKALLLQDFFRLGDFKYSETAPVSAGYDGTSVRVIAAFLAAKSGYCVHFASAMAVMARSLGIPARIAVGFLPGNRDVESTNSFIVTSHNLHAWPELYFDGIGWTRFEPTVSRGTLPDYANVASADVPTPVNAPALTNVPNTIPKAAAPVVPNSKSPIADGGTGSTPAAPVFSVNIFVLAVFVLLVLVLLPALIRKVQRARRLSAVRSGASQTLLAWQELLQSAGDLGIRIADTATPREAAALLSVVLAAYEADARRGEPATSNALAKPGRLLALAELSRVPDPVRSPVQSALDRLREAIERESYSPLSVISSHLVATDVNLVLRALRQLATPWKRLRATLLPPSSVSQFQSLFDRTP